MDYKKCTLCPRRCGVNRESGETGFCGAGKTIKIARAALHYWEEPCLSGKRGSGTVFFSGCTLRCIFCQNHQISTGGAGKFVSEDELCGIFLSLQEQGANNINLVTPTHFLPGIIAALKKAKNKGLTLPIVYNCGGYENAETIARLEGLVDIYLPDFKYYDNKIAEKYSAAKNYREIASAAIAEMVRRQPKAEFFENGIMKSGVIVRHLILPGHIFDSKKIIEYLYNEYKNNIWISIMNQYTPLDNVKNIPKLNRKLTKREYDLIVDYAAGIGVENAFVQEEGTAKESFIPQFTGEDEI